MTAAEPSPASGSDPAGDHHRQLANFRDLGGLPLTGGGVTQAGVLYRSDAPYPGDGVPPAAPVWPPATVIDLRSPGESAVSYPWRAGVTVHRVPLMRQAAVVTGGRERPPERSPGRGPGHPVSLEAVYLAMLQAVPDQLASLIGLAAGSPGPVLVHCAAGKDRTGVAVAVLLLAGGAEPASIVTDYTATASHMGTLTSRLQGLGRRLPVDVGPGSPLLGSPAEAITPVLDRLLSWPGGPHGWIAEHGGSPGDVRRWQERLTAAG